MGDYEMKVVYYKTLPVPDKYSNRLQYGFEIIKDGKMIYIVLVSKYLDGIKRHYINWYHSNEYSFLCAKGHIKHACEFLSEECTVVGMEDIKTFFRRKGMSIDNEAFFEHFTLDRGNNV